MTACTPARRAWLLVVLAALGGPAHGFQGRDEQAITAEMNEAIEQVKRIVNEPVAALPIPPGAEVAMFQPGWFHRGAMKPNFLSVDVRSSQQFPYDKWEYVTSDLSPGVMFRGRDLEFNPMTKYFYTDYSVPKKRLGPDEMTEVNRLYRIIGAREQDLARLHAGPSPSPAADASGTAARRGPAAVYVAAGALVLMLAIVVYRRRAARE